METVFTIGYEGASLPDFLETLCIAGVKVVADVRAVPVSRRRGFSQRPLGAALEDRDIEYAHWAELGDPKAGRDAARRGDISQFRRIFGAHLRLRETRDALSLLAQQATRSPVCLLCFERSHLICHRSMVAEGMQELAPFEVKHLQVRQGVSELRYASDGFDSAIVRSERG